MLENLDPEIQLAAKTETPLLITGASGADRARVARMIHGLRNGNPQRFVRQSGAELLASELVHLLSFTGSAGETTVFLDDVDRLPSPSQAVLSEFLDRRSARSPDPGSLHPRQPDLRVIVGTGKDLFALVRQRQFDPDLFYRLNELQVDLRRTRSPTTSPRA